MGNTRKFIDLGDGTTQCYVPGCGKIFKAKSHRADHVRVNHPNEPRLPVKVTDKRKRVNWTLEKIASVAKFCDDQKNKRMKLDNQPTDQFIEIGNDDSSETPPIPDKLQRRLAWENARWEEFNMKWTRGDTIAPFYYELLKTLDRRAKKKVRKTLLKWQAFHPDLSQMGDEEKYMDFLEYCGAHEAGICKIIPPPDWIPNKDGYQNYKDKNFDPIHQTITISLEDPECEDVFCCDEQPLGRMSGEKYENYAQQFHPNEEKDLERLEELFWKSIRTKTAPYAKDLEDSLFDKDLKGFNFRNIKSALATVWDGPGQGIKKPYAYLGCWMSLFCFHVEDKHFGGLNYLHFGSPKSWYGVPPSYGRKLEKAAEKALGEKYPAYLKKCREFFQHKNTILSPSFLKKEGIYYNKVDQLAGEIVVVFPYCYHQGYNNGYNCSEAVNWCNKRWLNYGLYSIKCKGTKCGFGKSYAVDLTDFVELFNPTHLQLWLDGKLMGHHPEHRNAEDRKCGKNKWNKRIPSDRLADDKDAGDDDDEQQSYNETNTLEELFPISNGDGVCYPAAVD